MCIKEYRATGGNKTLLKEYHRKSDSLAQWQINFSKYDFLTYAFDHNPNDKFRTMLCRELIKAFIDYGFNKNISTNGWVKTSLFQGFKDTFHYLTDEIIDSFISDLYYLLNNN